MRMYVDVKQIYIAMAEKGLNGHELAQAAGISQQAVSQVLNGQRRGTTKVLGAICKALGLSAKDVLIVED